MTQLRGGVVGLCVLLAACAKPALRTDPAAPADNVSVLDTIRVIAVRPRPIPDREAYQAARSASRDSLLRELAAARHRWALQDGQRIRYRWQEVCYCISQRASSDITIEAVRDSIVRIVNGRSLPSNYESSGNRRPSISYLMALAEGAIRGKADEIFVTFDPMLGIPTRVYVDRIVGTTDDEVDIRITDIHVIR